MDAFYFMRLITYRNEPTVNPFITNNLLSRPEIQLPSELGGHGHELNGHRCPCPRHGHGRGMDTKVLKKRGVDMVMVTEKSVKRGVDMDMVTENL